MNTLLVAWIRDGERASILCDPLEKVCTAKVRNDKSAEFQYKRLKAILTEINEEEI